MYIGQGIEETRSHIQVQKAQGNQKIIRDELLKNSEDYQRITNESSTFIELEQAKEATAITVYNFSNLWNVGLEYAEKPVGLNHLSEPDYQVLENSFGIYTLYQNYLFCNYQLFGRIENGTGE